MTEKHEKITRTWISWIGISAVIITILMTCIPFFAVIFYLLYVGKLSWNSLDPSESVSEPPHDTFSARSEDEYFDPNQPIVTDK